MTTRGDYSSLPGTVEELRRHERRIERRIEAEEAPATPQWPGGRPPHISRPGVTPW